MRLLIGTVAVGDTCKIRFEDIDTRIKERPLRFAEATISITAKSEDNGFLLLNYNYEALRSKGLESTGFDLFNQDSIAINRYRGIPMRTYLSAALDSRWDTSMNELVDLESSSYVLQ
jgi:hypothetical protein